MHNKLDQSLEEAVIHKIEGSYKSSFVLIDDPDNLIGESILYGLIESGWRITSITDPIELRFEYENQFRRGPSISNSGVIFIIRFPFKNVPYDISNEADIVHLSMKEFFPNLSYNVLYRLPAPWRSLVYSTHNERLSGSKPLNDKGTINFIIHECQGLDYGPEPSFIDTLSLLTDIALHGLELPPPVKSALVNQSKDPNLSSLFEYIDNPMKAIQFLQKVWQQYINNKLDKSFGIAEAPENPVTQSTIYLDNSLEIQTKVTALIAENLFQPVEVTDDAGLPTWLHPGIQYFRDKTMAVQEKLKKLAQAIPDQQAVNSDQ
jgi:hypothetical protein